MGDQCSCPSQLQEGKAKFCLFQVICFKTSRKQATHGVRQDTQTLNSILGNKQWGEGISCLAFPEIWTAVNQPCWTTSPGSHPTEHLWIQEKETWDSGISVSREVPPSDILSHRTHHDSSPPPQPFEEQRKMFLQDFCLPGVKTWEQICSQGMAKRRRVGKAGAFPGGEVPSERST